MSGQALLWIAVAIIAVVVLAAIWVAYQNRRRKQLRERFGPEYDRAVSKEGGDQRRAERALSEREARVKKLDIRPLPSSTRDQLMGRWRQVQERFVDDPRGAVNEADKLIGEAMMACGYPVGDFEQRAADVSVDHASVVTDYRDGHRIVVGDRRERATTEELRRAMQHFRSLFEDLVAPQDRAEERVTERQESMR